ncbi:MAG: tyrosine-type recombinase/integrase [Deltaproteobacteria bacterium]|nr:tyrosine-type recombinase/integrase [Deltaproteobacteria bacterium]
MKKKLTILTEADTQALLKGVWGRWGERDRHILSFLLHTGLKIQEFVDLKVEDMYTGNRVRKTLIIGGNKEKPERRVPLDRVARESAAMILEFNRRHGFKLENDEPFIVSRQRNKKDGSYHITPRQVQRIVKSLREDAKMGTKTTPQTLRHTFAKTMLDNGMDLQEVQKLLGHRSIKTTRDLYGI